ncbi:S8 family serine peptidase [Mycoplasmopsis gallinarum]|uniref:Peptidase S8/S53 domain-containing protein n=1 Tax=Mycoplasmopsis gallinarum TaxID=29557 RepID=A0A168R8V2_9BACT|nr:S8 family serine peptidase [Mycoplasmopsis gallinarum]OAB48726.1 hypothetical protein MGALLINA_05150 [Mycoplasmopsis gallinarum]
MELKKIIPCVLPITCFSISLNTNKENIDLKDLMELKNNIEDLKNFYKPYYEFLGIEKYRNINKSPAPKIGIIDKYYVKESLFFNENTKSKLFFVTNDGMNLKSVPSRTNNNANIYNNEFNNQIKEGSFHSTQIANILSGNVGISPNSDIYSSIIDEKNSDNFKNLLDFFRKENVNIVNISLGYTNVFSRELNLIFDFFFSKKLETSYKEYLSKSTEQTYIEYLITKFAYDSIVKDWIELIQNIMPENENKIDSFLQIFKALKKLIVNEKNDRNRKLMFFFRYFFDSEGLNSSYEERINYLKKVFYSEYKLDFSFDIYKKFFDSLFIFIEMRVQKKIMQNEGIYNKTKEGYFNFLNESNYLYNEIAEIIDEYAKKYKMKIIISAENKEFDFFIFRLIKKYNRELMNLYKNLNKFINTELEYNEMDQNGPKFPSAKNAIFVGSIKNLKTKEPSIFSTQGSIHKDDFPFVSLPGELNLTEKDELDNIIIKSNPNLFSKYINKKYTNKYLKILFTDINGTSFSAPFLAGFLALSEIVNNKISNLSVPEIKNLLISATDNLSGDFYTVNYFSNLANDAEAQFLHNNNFLGITGAGIPNFENFITNSKLKTGIKEIDIVKNGLNSHLIDKKTKNQINMGKIQFSDKQIKEIEKKYKESDEDIFLFMFYNISETRPNKKIRFSISWNSLMNNDLFLKIYEINANNKKNLLNEFNDFNNLFDLYFGDIEKKEYTNLGRDRNLSHGINSVTEMVSLENAKMFEPFYLIIKNSKYKEYKQLKLEHLIKTLKNGIAFIYEI